MIVFVLNCGSFSIKYQMIDMPSEQIRIRGSVSRIGYDDAVFTFITNTETRTIQRIDNHEQGINLILHTLEAKQSETGVGLCDIDAAGHRIVQGGSEMNVSRIIDDELIAYIERIAPLAPLHNPNHLKGIRAVGKLLPGLPQAAVFDNGYHTTIPDYIYTYALNRDIAQKHDIRKYGFHGIAFRSMMSSARQLLDESLDNKKVVNMMLGSGTTANATYNGKSFEVSTGFTPQEGLIQSTRAGDIDAAAVLYMMKQEHMTPDEADTLINKQSGWSGLSGIGTDMYDIKQAAANGDRQAQLTIDAAAHRFRKYIGAYAAAMGGIDVLIFSGGVGENDSSMREKICETLGFLGIQLDAHANHHGTDERIISTGRVKVLVVCASEEKMIAKDTYALLN